MSSVWNNGTLSSTSCDDSASQYDTFIASNSIASLEQHILEIFEGFSEDLRNSESAPDISWMRNGASTKCLNPMELSSSDLPQWYQSPTGRHLGASSSSLPLDALDFADSFPTRTNSTTNGHDESSVSLLTLDHIFHDDNPSFGEVEEADIATFHNTTMATASNASTWNSSSLSFSSSVDHLSTTNAVVEGIEVFEDELDDEFDNSSFSSHTSMDKSKRNSTASSLTVASVASVARAGKESQ